MVVRNTNKSTISNKYSEHYNEFIDISTTKNILTIQVKITKNVRCDYVIQIEMEDICVFYDKCIEDDICFLEYFLNNLLKTLHN